MMLFIELACYFRSILSCLLFVLFKYLLSLAFFKDIRDVSMAEAPSFTGSGNSSKFFWGFSWAKSGDWITWLVKYSKTKAKLYTQSWFEKAFFLKLSLKSFILLTSSFTFSILIQCLIPPNLSLIRAYKSKSFYDKLLFLAADVIFWKVKIGSTSAMKSYFWSLYY
jgi:hypothetical protein